MAPKTMEDWQVIRQNLVAVAEMERLRADSLQLLDQSQQLLRMIDRINSPLIAPSSGNEHGFGPQRATGADGGLEPAQGVPQGSVAPRRA